MSEIIVWPLLPHAIFFYLLSELGYEMYKEGNMDFFFEIEVDWDDVEQVAEDTYVLREDLYFDDYEVLDHGAFEDYEDDDYYDDDDETDSTSDSEESDY